MKKISKFLSITMLLSSLFSCNVDFKETIQVSLNIQEAKEKKVFVEEYKICNIRSFDHYQFPIQSIWEEKSWQLALDKEKNEIYKISDRSSNNLIFQLNGKDNLITEENFVNGLWIMSAMDNPQNLIGLTRGMINLSLERKVLKDTTSLAIFKLKQPRDYNHDLTLLFKFDIIRQ